MTGFYKDIVAAGFPGGAQGYVLPSHDAYRSEMPPAHNRRLEAATGFTGSAGVALFMKDEGALFTDGRYLLQASRQLDDTYFSVIDIRVFSVAAYLKERFPQGLCISYDPALFSVKEIRALTDGAPACDFIPARENPVDALWKNRPPAEKVCAEAHPIAVAGKSAGDKLRECAQALRTAGAGFLLETQPERVCRLFNMRGFDMPFTPALFSRAVIDDTGAGRWFIAPEKVSAGDKEALAREGVIVRDEAELPAFLRALPASANVIADSASVPEALYDCIAHTEILDIPSPLIDLQAVMTEAEIRAVCDAHVEDGLALTRFLLALRRDASGGVYRSECELAEILRGYRRAAAGYRRDSFDTIAGIDGNGAIIHYRPEPGKDARMSAGSRVLLLDSGGQYQGGTTDITRTVALPGVREEEKRFFTLVLKGHIALARAVFPEGATGGDLDMQARAPLWAEGADYAHGTGHGVGCYMGVHDGPQRIARRASVPLRAGMLLSNEPGYYKEGEYGIRIENLILVEPAHPGFLRFRTVSLAPIDERMVLFDMLDANEKIWLRDYHRDMEALFSPRLSVNEAEELRRICGVYAAA